MNVPKRALLAAIGLSFALTAQAESEYDKAVHVYGCADYPKAFKLFKPLAEQGDALSQFQVGMMIEQGQGAEVDFEAAYKWYMKAAEQGVADAYFALGQLYSRGLAVAQDPVRAYSWFDLAVRDGHAVAGDWLKMQSEKMRPEQVKAAQSVSSDWLRKMKK